jgi:hypothetical protein
MKMTCPKDGCNGRLEAMSRIYLDITDATVREDGELTLHGLEFSHLNDHFDGHPCNVEGEFDVQCENGHEFAGYFDDALRWRLGLQPTGNAERVLGERGGTREALGDD